MNDPTKIRRLYGRRSGHALRAGQAALVEELLPRVAVPETGALDARVLFGGAWPLEFEIGFGSGEHLAGQAESRPRSEEHTSELQSLMRISYAVFCLKKKKKKTTDTYEDYERIMRIETKSTTETRRFT